jgi:hypothetical protein
MNTEYSEDELKFFLEDAIKRINASFKVGKYDYVLLSWSSELVPIIKSHTFPKLQELGFSVVWFDDITIKVYR